MAKKQLDAQNIFPPLYDQWENKAIIALATMMGYIKPKGLGGELNA